MGNWLTHRREGDERLPTESRSDASVQRVAKAGERPRRSELVVKSTQRRRTRAASTGDLYGDLLYGQGHPALRGCPY